jgi:hypothetical protein
MGYAMERSWNNFFKNSHYQACRIPGWNKPYWARSIVHYLVMDRVCKEAYDSSSFANIESSNDFYPFLWISIFGIIFDNEMCTM